MKSKARRLLIPMFFAVSIVSVAGCYYYHDYDRDYAYYDRYGDSYWHHYYTRDDLDNRHLVPDHRFGDRNYGED